MRNKRMSVFFWDSLYSQISGQQFRIFLIFLLFCTTTRYMYYMYMCDVRAPSVQNPKSSVPLCRSFRSHVHRQFTGKPLSPEEEPPPSHVRARLSPLVQAWTGLYPNPQPASRRESPFSRTMRVLARNYRKNFGGGRGRFTTRRRKAAGPLWWWQRWLPLRRINWG